MAESQPQTVFRSQPRFQLGPRFQPEQGFTPETRYQPQSRFQPEPRFRVSLDMEALRRCLCRECQVQASSECARPKITMVREMISRVTPEALKVMTPDQIAETMPEAQDLPGPYCSIGEAACGDLDYSRPCVCPQCQVFAEFNLGRGKPTEYFCREGGAARNI